MEIYLIRHTMPAVPPDVCYGHADIPLADSFENDWLVLKSKIPANLDYVFSSPLLRCRTLAQRLTAKEQRIDLRLRELDFGDWEGKKWDELDQKELTTWMDNFVLTGPPNGESFQQLYTRTTGFWEELAELSFERIALVTHAGVIRTILAYLLSIPLKDVFQLSIDYGKVSLIEIDGDRRTVNFINS